ncbi:hypothetical protein [Brucella pseudogrignonensis]|uniref:hypothetical protein n=1 Tax=Brucella pseudogrignonensis TaxID=419475 RepID=UPI0038D16672
MIEECKAALSHFVPEYVYFIDKPKSFSIEEKKAGGAGKAFFSSATPCLMIKAKDQAPLVWAFKNKKCAEGAFLTFEDDGMCNLHILEMKSKLTQGEWAKVMLQLSGMYLSALATCRLLGIISFKSVTCYVAFKEDAMSPAKSADMIFLKSFVGAENPIGGADEWQTGKMELPFSTPAAIRKGQRNASNDIDFGTV